MATSCSGDARTESQAALILIGGNRVTSFDKHARALVNNVVNPIKPDIFALTDAGGAAVFGKLSLASSLPLILGDRLRVIGLMNASEEVLNQLRGEYPATNVTAVPPPTAKEGASLQSGTCKLSSRFDLTCMQWYRLRECWKLLEAGETRREGQRRYQIVFKLRFDWTPLGAPWCRSAIAHAANTPSAIYASTDHAFWGAREAMAVTANTFDAIRTHFASGTSGHCADPLHRPLYIGAMLDSLRGMHAEATNRRTWILHNKLLALPWVQLLSNRSKVSRREDDDGGANRDFVFEANANVTGAYHSSAASLVMASLSALQRAGWDYVPPEAGTLEGLSRRRGLLAAHSDSAVGMFASEAGFPIWLLANNVTVCDVGVGIKSILFKGRALSRQSVSSCASPSPRPPVEAQMHRRYDYRYGTSTKRSESC